jgi:Carboxypeptidase regulatory-like domain
MNCILKRLISLSVLVGLSFAGHCFAQIDKGTIAGTVKDAQGAVVPGANITITDTDTQQQRSLVTDKSGAYSAELLTAGTYSVAAEASGFTRAQLPGVQVGVNQVVRIDLELNVGSASQTVEVSAAPPILSTETSSLSTIETGQRIVNLPLNGRNFTQLAWLGPGATPGSSAGIGLTTSTDDPRQGVQLAVNGLFGFDNNFLLDGVDNNEFGEGTIAVQPSPDALQTFSIEESSMKAEFGRGGAAVNAVLKSGTNSFHGGGFEYFRNSALDAANFFATTGKPPFKRNQFGGFLGGPIIKDRTFFFGDYQGTRYNEGVTYVSTVPTQAERNGDFSALGLALYDPYTTASDSSRALINPANPGVIPTNRIDPVGKAVVNLLPLPTVSGAQTNNYVTSPSQTYTDDQFDARVDHSLRPADHLFAHGGYERIVFSKPPPLGAAGGCCNGIGSHIKTRYQNYAVGETHTFSSNLLNDARFAYIRFGVGTLGYNSGKDISEEAGIPNANRGDANTSGLSLFNLSGYGFNNTMGGPTYVPELVADNTFQVADSVILIHGRHSIKFGVDFHRMQRNFYQSQAPAGQFTFTGQFTQNLNAQPTDPNYSGEQGNAIADLLLGIPIAREQDGLAGKDPTRYWELAEFAQDDYRVTDKLTLNLGFRYDIFSPVGGKVGNFDLARGVLVNNYGPNAVSNAGVKFDLSDIGPRFGFAYNVLGNGKTVFSGAFGEFYSPEGNQFNDIGENPPLLQYYSQQLTATTIPGASTLLSAGFPTILPSIDPANPTGQVKTNGPTRKAPRVLEWNLAAAQQLASTISLRVAYVATRATGIWNNEVSNLDQPLQPLDSNFSDSTGNFGRPYFNQLPGLSSIYPIDYPNFSLFYNALQTKLEKRLSNGSTFLAAYTWSKNLGTSNGQVGGQIQNAHDAKAQYGYVDPDYRHRFVASYTYELPFGRGRRFGGNLNRAVDAVAGGWQTAGIITARTGEAYTAFLSYDPTNTGTGGPWPNRIHNPKDFSFNVSGQQALGCPGGKQTLTCFYNPAAFVIPPLAPGQLAAHEFGNSGNGALRGPDQVNVDFSAIKDFHVTEAHTVQFRAELFNMFNHPQFQIPGANPNVPGGQAITSTLTDNQREVQFALRYTF